MKSPAVLVLSSLLLSISTVLAQTWSPTGAPITNWSAIACSADGSLLIAAGGGQSGYGYIYTSSDSGSNWTIAALASNHWTSVACSADGTVLAAGASSSGAYFSTNSGTNWSAPLFSSIPLGPTVAVSGDGSLWAQPFGGALYRSTNLGAAWFTNHQAFFDSSALAVSADGRLLNVGRNTGYVAYSTNSAVTWAGSNLLAGNISSFSSSADGGNVLCLGAGVYHSSNSGRTWITDTLSPSTGWQASASSADGAKLLISSTQGRIYSSANFGQVWTSNSVPALSWTAVASSADGCVLFAAASNGGIWVSRTTPAPVLNLAASKNGIILSWTIPSLTFELEQNSDLSTAQWLLLNPPTFVPTNLQYRLSLPALDIQAFFRLIARQ